MLSSIHILHVVARIIHVVSHHTTCSVYIHSTYVHVVSRIIHVVSRVYIHTTCSSSLVPISDHYQYKL